MQRWQRWQKESNCGLDLKVTCTSFGRPRWLQPEELSLTTVHFIVISAPSLCWAVWQDRDWLLPAAGLPTHSIRFIEWTQLTAIDLILWQVQSDRKLSPLNKMPEQHFWPPHNSIHAWQSMTQTNTYSCWGTLSTSSQTRERPKILSRTRWQDPQKSLDAEYIWIILNLCSCLRPHHTKSKDGFHCAAQVSTWVIELKWSTPAIPPKVTMNWLRHVIDVKHHKQYGIPHVSKRPSQTLRPKKTSRLPEIGENVLTVFEDSFKKSVKMLGRYMGRFWAVLSLSTPKDCARAVKPAMSSCKDISWLFTPRWRTVCILLTEMTVHEPWRTTTCCTKIQLPQFQDPILQNHQAAHPSQRSDLGVGTWIVSYRAFDSEFQASDT